MPPIIALCLCFGFIAWLTWSDVAIRGPMEKALWVPFIWLLIRGSRPVTSWFGAGGGGVDGNPKEALIALIIFGAAFLILQRRRFELSRLPHLNVLFFILFVYLGLSCLWAPLPFVAFKRWFKEFGNILVILVILTSYSPGAALRTIAVRASYILIPLSLTLNKFYPALARDYSKAGGKMLTGVTNQKNSLGVICCVLGLCLIWEIVERRKRDQLPMFCMSLKTQWIILCMTIWVLLGSQSKTSLLAFLFGSMIFLAPSLPFVRGMSQGFAKLCLIGTIAGLVVGGLATTVAAPLLEALGRDATFTGRTDIWESVLAMPTNPLIGTGFDGFWIEYAERVWARFDNFRLTSTHSGYIDMYLNGGVIGCILLGLCMFISSWRLAEGYSADDSLSRIKFVFILNAIIMNFSESFFFRLGSMWFFVVFTLLAMTLPGRSRPHEGMLPQPERNW